MFNNLRITQRFILILLAYWISFMAVVIVSFMGLTSARDSLRLVHDQAMQRALMAEESMSATVQNRLEVLLAFQHSPENPLASVHKHPTSQHLEAIANIRTQATATNKAMEDGIVDPQERELYEATKPARAAWRAKLDETTAALAAGNYRGPSRHRDHESLS